MLVVALLVLGPQKLPDAARSLGRAIGEVRRYTSGFQDEMRDAFAEPEPSASPPPPVTAGETAQVGEPIATDPPPTGSHPDNGDAPSP